MTRGTLGIVYESDVGILLEASTEFNGDMYLTNSGRGTRVLSDLRPETVYDQKSFVKYLERFNREEGFNYREDLLEYQIATPDFGPSIPNVFPYKDRCLNPSEFPWYSDYSYILNLYPKDIYVLFEFGYSILKPNHGIVLHYNGHYDLPKDLVEEDVEKRWKNKYYYVDWSTILKRIGKGELTAKDKINIILHGYEEFTCTVENTFDNTEEFVSEYVSTHSFSPKEVMPSINARELAECLIYELPLFYEADDLDPNYYYKMDNGEVIKTFSSPEALAEDYIAEQKEVTDIMEYCLDQDKFVYDIIKSRNNNILQLESGQIVEFRKH